MAADDAKLEDLIDAASQQKRLLPAQWSIELRIQSTSIGQSYPLSVKLLRAVKLLCKIHV